MIIAPNVLKYQYMEIGQAEKMLKALANRRRLKIIKYLEKNGKASVTELSGFLKLSFRSTSRHLAILRNAEIVDVEQVGLVCFYTFLYPQNSLIKQCLTIV
jgi:DNA-binding transcriptional ArsR family regulator